MGGHNTVILEQKLASDGYHSIHHPINTCVLLTQNTFHIPIVELCNVVTLFQCNLNLIKEKVT